MTALASDLLGLLAPMAKLRELADRNGIALLAGIGCRTRAARATGGLAARLASPRRPRQMKYVANAHPIGTWV